jgi:hypothetical protein
MSYRTLSILLIALLVLGEAGLALWRHLPVEPSAAPIFSFPPAAQNFDKPGNLAPAIELYGADRGAEWNHSTPDGTRLTVFYFEWDQVAVGPMMEATGHTPEVCNVSAGFTLEAVLPRSVHEVPGQPPLVFDTTRYTAPNGEILHIYKLAWIQGLGSQTLREAYERFERLQNSFIRHKGAARVLQIGVQGATDSEQAWKLAKETVLDQLKW